MDPPTSSTFDGTPPRQKCINRLRVKDPRRNDREVMRRVTGSNREVRSEHTLVSGIVEELRSKRCTGHECPNPNGAERATERTSDVDPVIIPTITDESWSEAAGWIETRPRVRRSMPDTNCDNDPDGERCPVSSPQR